MTAKNKKGLILASAVLILLVIIGISVWRNGNTGKDNGSTADPSSPVVELVYDRGDVKEIPVEDFSAYLLGTDKPIFIDFWAAWCPPCTAAAPFVKSLAAEYDGRAHVLKVNVDYAGSIAAMYNVQSIPLFVMIQDNQAVDSQIGYSPALEADLRDMIEKRLP